MEKVKFMYDMMSISQQSSCWKDRARVEVTFTRGYLAMLQRQSLTMCDNPNKVNSTDDSTQLTFHVTWPAWLFCNFCNLSRLILKIGGFTPLLTNHKKGIFRLKRAFLGESQRPVRRLSSQVSSFRLETH